MFVCVFVYILYEIKREEKASILSHIKYLAFNVCFPENLNVFLAIDALLVSINFFGIDNLDVLDFGKNSN